MTQTFGAEYAFPKEKEDSGHRNNRCFIEYLVPKVFGIKRERLNFAPENNTRNRDMGRDADVICI